MTGPELEVVALEAAERISRAKLAPCIHALANHGTALVELVKACEAYALDGWLAGPRLLAALAALHEVRHG